MTLQEVQYYLNNLESLYNIAPDNIKLFEYPEEKDTIINLIKNKQAATEAQIKLIMTDPIAIACYALNQKGFPEAESIIAQLPALSIYYAVRVLKKRFEPGELKIVEPLMIMAYVLGTAETNPSAEYWLLKQQVNKDFLNIIQVYLSVLDEIGAKPITHEIAMLREDLKQQTIQITDVAKFVQALNDIAVAIKKAKETQDTYL
jgi:hypothetical protein